MVSALVLVADGSEEIETCTPYDVFVRAGFSVTLAGVGLTADQASVTMSRGLKLVPDMRLEALDPHAAASFDLLVLPGGAGGADTFCRDETTQALLKQYYHDPAKLVGTICAASTAVAAAGLHSGRPITGHPSVMASLRSSGLDAREDRVVVSGRLVSSRGPGTSLLFAFTLVELAAGKELRDKVAGPMLALETTL